MRRISFVLVAIIALAVDARSRARSLRGFAKNQDEPIGFS